MTTTPEFLLPARVGVRQSEIAVRQNEDMRKISAWAAIALVPTAIAGIYGMNFDHMPELRWQYGYGLAVGIMATAMFTLHRMFRKHPGNNPHGQRQGASRKEAAKLFQTSGNPFLRRAFLKAQGRAHFHEAFIFEKSQH